MPNAPLIPTTRRCAPLPVSCLFPLMLIALAATMHAASSWTLTPVALDGQAGIASVTGGSINDRGVIAVAALRTVDQASVTEDDSRNTLLQWQGGVLVPIVLPGTVLGNGLGTLNSIGIDGGVGGDTRAVAIDQAGRVYFKARVRGGTLPGGETIHLFRWEGGTNITYLLNLSDRLSPTAGRHLLKHMLPDGRWVIRRSTGTAAARERTYLLTDGTTTTEIARIAEDEVTDPLSNDCFTRKFAHADNCAVTLAGHLIGLETRIEQLQAPGDPNCGSGGSQSDSAIQRHAPNQAPEILVTATLSGAPAAGTSGISIDGVVANLTGGIAYRRRRAPEPSLVEIVRRDASGEVVLYSELNLAEPGLTPVAGLHDLDEAGRVVWSGHENGSTERYTLYAGPVLTTDRVVGAGDVIQGETLETVSLVGVAHPPGSLSDQRQLLVGFFTPGFSKFGLLLAARTGIRWANPAGGAWNVGPNWTFGGVPNQADAATFDLEASYDVSVGAHTAGRALVENGSVGFQSADLTLTGPLFIGGDATLTMPGGSLRADEIVVGHLPPPNVTNEPSARFNASGQTLSLVVDKSVVVGQAGLGEMTVTQGIVQSEELRIGDGSAGALTLGMDGTEWRVGSSVGVGFRGRGMLNIERGAFLRVEESLTIGVAASPPGPGGWLVVDDAGAAAPADLGNVFVRGALTIGGDLPGQLEIRNGGVVAVAGVVPFSIKTAHRALSAVAVEAQILITGTNATTKRASELSTFGEAVLGLASDTLTVVRIEDGGNFFVGENLVLADAPGSTVNLLVSGVATNGGRSTLEVLRSTEVNEGLVIGKGGRATVSVRDGSLLKGRDIFIGHEAGSRGTLFVGGRAQGKVASVEVTSASPSLIGSILVGGSRLSNGDDTARGELILDDGYVDAPYLLVGPSGIVRGHGTIVVGEVMDLGGTVAPELDIEPPLQELDSGKALMSDGLARSARAHHVVPLGGGPSLKSVPGTLTIRGNVSLQPTARVVLDVAGSAPDAADRIVVQGALALGGTLEIAFSNGYAPKAGDTLDLVSSSSVTGAFATNSVMGLAPGFQFSLAPSGAGGVRLTALNDGVPATAGPIRLSGIQPWPGGQFRIAWSTNAIDYRLEASLDLGGGWKDGESAWGFLIVTEGAERVAYVPGGEAARFFRLVKP